MTESLGNLLRRKRTWEWDEVDVRHFVQNWLRQETHTQELYCERVREGKVYVRAVSPAVRQAVRLLEYDLRLVLREQADFTLEELVF